MISFNQIPLHLERPGNYVEFDFTKMQSGLATPKAKVLIVGQMLATGTGVASTLYRIDGPEQGKQLFGQGSMLAGMIDAWMQNDRTIQVWALGLVDNAAGVKAAGTFTYTGPATASGTLEEMVEDQRIQVGVTVGMTATQIATAVAAEINSFPDLAVTAASSAGVVTVTARHKGAEGNSIYLAHNYHQGDVTPAGVSVTISPMASGATNPDASAVFTAIGDAPFQFIVSPWNDATNIAVFETALADRASAMKMNYGVALSHSCAGYSSLITAAASRNSAFAPISAMKGTPWPSWKMAAGVAAQVAFSFVNGVGRPFNGLVVKGALPPVPADRFHSDELEGLLSSGISTLYVNAAEQVCIQRMVTTYKTNALGFADTGLHRLNALLLMFYLSWSQQARVTQTFPRHKLGNDGGNYAPGQPIATPSQVKAVLAALATEWGKAALIENVSDYIASLRVERDETDPDRLNSFQRPDLINEFNTLASLIQPIS